VTKRTAGPRTIPQGWWRRLPFRRDRFPSWKGGNEADRKSLVDIPTQQLNEGCNFKEDIDGQIGELYVLIPVLFPTGAETKTLDLSSISLSLSLPIATRARLVPAECSSPEQAGVVSSEQHQHETNGRADGIRSKPLRTDKGEVKLTYLCSQLLMNHTQIRHITHKRDKMSHLIVYTS
jgi:hypothetical protein